MLKSYYLGNLPQDVTAEDTCCSFKNTRVMLVMLYRGNYFTNGLFNELYGSFFFVVAVALFVPQKRISKRLVPKPSK